MFLGSPHPHWISNLEINSKHKFHQMKLHLLEEEAGKIEVFLNSFCQRENFISVH